jgi:hypothetical protein
MGQGLVLSQAQHLAQGGDGRIRLGARCSLVIRFPARAAATARRSRVRPFRKHLAHHQRAIGGAADQIGEGAAAIDPEPPTP